MAEVGDSEVAIKEEEEVRHLQLRLQQHILLIPPQAVPEGEQSPRLWILIDKIVIIQSLISEFEPF